MIPLLVLLLSCSAVWAAVQDSKPTAAAKTSTAIKVRTLTWDDLLPEAERNAPPTNTPSIKSYKLFGGDDSLPPQSGSTAVNKQIDGLMVKLPGYIVPLDMEGNKVRSFFLVPYYGACIHVPPPPPNQMVYVELTQPISSNDLYNAQWVTGKLSTQSKANRFAIATYTLQASKVETYREP